MLSKQDLQLLYDTLLSTPRMQELIKIDFRIPRKNALLLSKVIQRGLSSDSLGKDEELTALSTKENREELERLVEEILLKAGLKEMNEKLNSFS